MSDLERLKHLLLAEERAALDRAGERIDELERERDGLAAALPDLVRAAPREPMTRALSAPVAAALGSAVRDNSRSVIDALFPVIGPMIRKAIAEALRGLMADLNGVLEQSFTLHGIRWRVQAWRGGVPYAQVVLKHSLRYQIDHVFLIERDSGLVVHRESSAGLPDLDADAIAGMLTAIGQFVRDSVGRGGEGDHSLESARVGEYLLWVVDGPRASLACFINGVPPEPLRGILVERLEAIHAQIGDAREDHSAMLRAQLDPLELLRAGASATTAAPRPSRAPLLILALIALAAIAWTGVRAWRWDARVETARVALSAHPGLLLTEVESRRWRSLTFRGLLDPDASPPAAVLAGIDFGEVQPLLRIDGYLSTDDPVIERRARRLLQPPAGVAVAVDAGVLVLRGRADSAWIAMARVRAPWVAGVQSARIDVSALDIAPASAESAADVARAELDALAADLEARTIGFVRELELEADADAQLDAIVSATERARALQVAAQVTLRLRALGHNDVGGSDELNANLRAARAQWLVDALVARGVPANLFEDGDAAAAGTGDAILVRGARVRLEQEPVIP